jgi:hypothetical protein
MGINESNVNDGNPTAANVIQLLPKCINDFYVGYEGNDENDCDSDTNAC